MDPYNNEGREGRVEVELPYALTWDDLHLEPYSNSGDPMQWFFGMNCNNEEEIIRVWTAAIALRLKYPEHAFEQCLETAIIYERG